MSAPSYAEFVTAVRREGEGIHTAAGLGLDGQIATLGGWTTADLVRHVGDVYTYVTKVVAGRVTQQPERPGFGGDADLLDDFAEALDDLVAALTDADADAPVWNWTPDQPHHAAFWARRMAHESAVHRFDAQSAHGVVQPVEAELASDGIEELLDVMVPRVYRRDEVSGPTGTVRLDSSDDGFWCLQLQPDGVTRIDVIDAPDVSVRASSSALLLAGYTRMPWTSLDTSGDVDLLVAWSQAVNP